MRGERVTSDAVTGGSGVSENMWHYRIGGQQFGPLSSSEMRTLLDTGEIDEETMVWTGDLSDWIPLGQADDLLHGGGTIPGNLQEDGSAGEDPVLPRPEGDKRVVRPWVRYWGRIIDLLLFGVMFGLILGYIYPPMLTMSDRILGMLILFFYVFVDALLLSSWGTTPGKALLKVKVRTGNGKKLRYGDALQRSFSVWFRGLGLGIPVVSLFTLIFSYSRLKKSGITVWDEKGGYVVSHEHIGVARVITTILLMIFFGYLIVLGDLQS